MSRDNSKLNIDQTIQIDYSVDIDKSLASDSLPNFFDEMPVKIIKKVNDTDKENNLRRDAKQTT
jgi:hypothetical protein